MQKQTGKNRAAETERTISILLSLAKQGVGIHLRLWGDAMHVDVIPIDVMLSDVMPSDVISRHYKVMTSGGGRILNVTVREGG